MAAYLRFGVGAPPTPARADQRSVALRWRAEQQSGAYGVDGTDRSIPSDGGHSVDASSGWVPAKH